MEREFRLAGTRIRILTAISRNIAHSQQQPRLRYALRKANPSMSDNKS